MRLLVINGPNINMIGIREPEIYGKQTYEDLLALINKSFSDNGVEGEVFQSNHEGAIIDKIQSAYQDFDGIVINPGAYTHTSLAILDALKSVNIPTAEVHISDPSQREEYRKVSYVAEYAVVSMKGMGLKGYADAIRFLKNFLAQ